MGEPTADQIRCMIAGVHKCGTTSLRDQLAEHPDLTTHSEMEMTYFSPLRDEYESPSPGASLIPWYFPDAPPGTLLLAKHATACCDAREMSRLAAHSPGCRIILSVRDPVERAHSAYLMESGKGRRQLPFPALVDEMLSGTLEEDDWRVRIYLRWGCYDEHLERVHSSFSPDAVRVVAVEELRDRPGEVVDDLLGWLGCDPADVPILEARNVATEPRWPRLADARARLLRDTNPVKKVARRVLGRRMTNRWGQSLREVGQVPIRHREQVDPQTRDRLREYFADSVARLETASGAQFRNLWGWTAAAEKSGG